MKKFSLTTILTLFGFICFAQIKFNSSSDILLELNKLKTAGSVLYIAAHPDDENTRLLAYLANEMHLRTAYLSLTRGDGGQNLIGSEQGIELGMIRTHELLEARKIDGGIQFFTRAYDFGYSKSPEETLTKWNKDSVLADMVYIIRTFKPDVIITRFATDGSGGHGHHTASALLAEEAFDAAANPDMFSWQINETGLWKAKRLVWNVSTRFANPNADMSQYIPLNVGGFNNILGKSYGEIAAQSRSMHKSQGFGSSLQRGNYYEYFQFIKGDKPQTNSIFDGIDFSLARFNEFKAIEKILLKTIKIFDALNPHKSVQTLLAVKELLKKINSTNKDLINHKIWFEQKLDDIILQCLGIYTEATANKFYTSFADSLQIQLNIIKRNNDEYKVILIRHNLSNNNNIVSDTVLPINDWYKYTYQTKVNTKTYSQIPWIKNGLQNNMLSSTQTYYANNEGDFSRVITVLFKINEKHFIEKQIPVIYKWVEPDKGELYRPVLLSPPVTINISKEQLLFCKPEVKTVTFRFSAIKDNITFTPFFETDETYSIKALNRKVYKNLPTGLILDDYTLNKSGDFFEVTLSVEPKPNAAKAASLQCFAMVDGEKYGVGLNEIKYNHIPIQSWFPDATVNLNYEPIETKSKLIGYVNGPGDGVAECLKQLGYKVFEITDEFWKTGDLKLFDAVVVGVRAYNTSEVLNKQKQLILDYLKNGGNVVVQYQTNNFFGPLNQNIGPYPFKISRNRITDENAEVNLLVPEHPAFNKPNKITSKDFENWVQERSIYHATAWDNNFTPLISMADPNEKPDEGGLIVCKYGKGNYVYTGLSFFRQLPAANTGALKLLVNLIELGK
ncbi:MAG: PIG-L family deacetylase [Bacteroidia bacterium]